MKIAPRHTSPSGMEPHEPKRTKAPASPMVENSPQAKSGQALQSLADNSSRVTQAKSNQLLANSSPRGYQAAQMKAVVQLGKKKEDDEDWKPPSERRKHRSTFGKALRRRVIMSSAKRNRRRLYVCPGCGMPLADRNGREIRTYYISKSGKRHNRVSADIDHYPPWAPRLARLKKKRASTAAIRKDHDDETRLRAFCHRCNQSHKYESSATPDNDFSDDDYQSDDDDRDKEIWKNFRGPGGGAGGAGVAAN